MSDSKEDIVEVKIEEKADQKKPRELPGKLNDCQGTIILFKSSIGAGVLKTKNHTGSINCMFLADNVVIPDIKDPRDVVGQEIFCDAWLMKDTDYIPYLASVVWKGTNLPAADKKQRILSNPSSSDMDAYAKDVARLGQTLREDGEDRRSHKKHKKRRSGSRDRKRDRRSNSNDRRSRKKYSRSRSRSRSRDRSSKKKHRRRDSSRDSDESDEGGGATKYNHRNVY